MARRMHSADGTTLGLLGGFIKLDFFENYWHSVMDRSESESAIALIRLDGTVLARFPGTHLIGQKFADGIQSLLHDSNAVVVQKLGAIDNKMRIEAARMLDDYPLFVLAAQSEDAALHGWRRTAEFAVLETTGCILVVCSRRLWDLAVVVGISVPHACASRSDRGRTCPDQGRGRTRVLWESGQQTARLNAAIENMSHGLLMFDAQERLVVFNSRWLQMHGLSADAVKPGCSLIELLQHRFATGLLAYDPDALSGRDPGTDCGGPQREPRDEDGGRARNRGRQPPNAGRRLGHHPRGRHRAPPVGREDRAHGASRCTDRAGQSGGVDGTDRRRMRALSPLGRRIQCLDARPRLVQAGQRYIWSCRR